MKDMKSIENWCKTNGLDVHIQRKRKYVYEHELKEILEKNYINDTKKNHPTDFLERCINYVSYYSLTKYSGFTASNSTSSVPKNPYSFFPSEVQELLKTI
jgi:hypothetical protein